MRIGASVQACPGAKRPAPGTRPATRETPAIPCLGNSWPAHAGTRQGVGWKPARPLSRRQSPWRRTSRTGRGPVTAAGGTGTFTLPERSAGAWSATIRGRGKARRPVSLPGEDGTAAEPVRQGRRQGDPCPPGAPPAARRRGPECDSGSTGRDTKRGDGGRATRPITRFMNMHHGGHQPPSPRPYLS
jgi:hypothetical protein